MLADASGSRLDVDQMSARPQLFERKAVIVRSCRVAVISHTRSEQRIELCSILPAIFLERPPSGLDLAQAGSKDARTAVGVFLCPGILPCGGSPNEPNARMASRPGSDAANDESIPRRRIFPRGGYRSARHENSSPSDCDGPNFIPATRRSDRRRLLARPS